MLPPSFAYNSRCIPRQVSIEYFGTLTCATPLQPTGINLFSAKLQDVFTTALPRASHPPAAFCQVPSTATSSFHSLIIYIEILTYLHFFVKSIAPLYCLFTITNFLSFVSMPKDKKVLTLSSKNLWNFYTNFSPLIITAFNDKSSFNNTTLPTFPGVIEPY